MMVRLINVEINSTVMKTKSRIDREMKSQSVMQSGPDTWDALYTCNQRVALAQSLVVEKWKEL